MGLSFVKKQVQTGFLSHKKFSLCPLFHWLFSSCAYGGNSKIEYYGGKIPFHLIMEILVQLKYSEESLGIFFMFLSQCMTVIEKIKFVSVFLFGGVGYFLQWP